MKLEHRLPVLICAYSRHKEFINVLNMAIKAGSKKIYVNFDGSESLEVQQCQIHMIDYINWCRRQYSDLQINVRRSTINLGAAVSVISSIDWFFSFEDFGLILEDDLEFNESLFSFASWAEKYYRVDRDVWVLAGTNFLGTSDQYVGRLQFPNYPVTWGWATWNSKWSLMRKEILSINSGSQSFLQFDPVLNYWQVGARRAKLGLIDAWDIPLAEAMRRLGKFSLIPPVNLVRNIGYSELASNTNVQRYPLDLEIQEVKPEDFNEALLRSPAGGLEINKVYEKEVYRISLRNRFTSMLAILDTVRFRKRHSIPLSIQVESVQTIDHEIF